MRITTLLAALALAVTAALPGAATPGPPPDDYEPEFVEQPAWFHAHSLPVGNADAREGRFVRWDDQQPTGAAPAVYQNTTMVNIFLGYRVPERSFTAEGTFTGDLDTLAFDMYFSGWAQAAIGLGMGMSFDLRIDGIPVISQEPQGSWGVHYEQVSDGVYRARVALTNIWEASKVYRLPYGPDVVHDLHLNIETFYAGNEYTWQYDAASTPSGLTANLESPASKGYFEIDVLDPPPPFES